MISHPTSCATTSAAGRKRCRKPIARSLRIAPSRTRRCPSARDSPDDERRRRHHAALLGTKLAPESWDFKVVSETTRRYGASRIPKGSTVEDWPFGLEELEPYYDKVEYEIGVSGQAGNIKGKIDPRGNTFEGPRAREYPMPPLRGTASPR
jgi:hypothetical protein